jgi:hypothetical protein
MDGESRILDKLTCQFKLPNGEPCKRIVNKAGNRCWQHARGFSQKWKALVCNRTLLFVCAVIGVPSAYFTFDSWRLSRNDTDTNPLHVTLTPGPPAKGRLGVLKFTAPKEGWLSQWGDTPPNVLYGVTPGVDLGPAKDQYRFILVARMDNPTIDQMEDTTILKSVAYSIKNETTMLAIPVSQDFLLRVAPAHMVYISLILLPSTVHPDQIRKLADVEKRGGGILATNAFLYKTVTVVFPLTTATH